jgi:hypothetical protein
MKKKYWLQIVWGDLEPELFGPFEGMLEVEKKLIRLFRAGELSPDIDGKYLLTQTGQTLIASAFSGGYMYNVALKASGRTDLDPQFPLYSKR